jgi:V8-like Glu-specific endopeptidase
VGFLAYILAFLFGMNAWASARSDAGICGPGPSPFEGTLGNFSSLVDHLLLPPNLGPTTNLAGIYGKDGRVLLDNALLYPFRAIGKLNRAEQTGPCTATLISACHVLTAAHCVVNSDGSLRKLKNFEAAFTGGSAGLNQVLHGGSDYDANRGNDWAVARLDSRLGDVKGHMGLRKSSGSELVGKSYYISCYAWDFKGGKKLFLEENAEIVKTGKWLLWGDANLVKFRADVAAGCSGAAIFEMDEQGGAWIVGVLAAGRTEYRYGKPVNPRFSDDETGILTVGVATGAFFEKAREFMDKNPCPKPDGPIQSDPSVKYQFKKRPKGAHGFDRPLSVSGYPNALYFKQLHEGREEALFDLLADPSLTEVEKKALARRTGGARYLKMGDNGFIFLDSALKAMKGPKGCYYDYGGRDEGAG